jgi:glycosyltransferase involved in cell wall biosynthesis
VSPPTSTLRVTVDARPAAFPQKTGIGYYTWHMLRLLPRVAPDARFSAWYLDARGGLERRRPFEAIGAPNFSVQRTPIPSRWFERASERFDLPRVEWFSRFDVLFAPNFVPPPTRSRRTVLTVHDLALRRFPDTAPQATRRWLARLDRALRQAAMVIAVSECTKLDLMELYGLPEDRIAVVHHGLDHETFRPASDEAVRAVRGRFGIDGPYLMFLGGIEPRKNLSRLVEAFARLERDVRPSLVLAGAGVAWNPEGWDQLRPALDALPADVRSRIVLTGYLSEPDKVALLSGATAMVYPSLYEGFGMPVLEAMGCGSPVVASNVSALPEVAGDAAVLVDPRDADALVAGIDRVLREDGLKDALRQAGLARAAGFHWEDTARRTMEVLRQAAP